MEEKEEKARKDKENEKKRIEQEEQEKKESEAIKKREKEKLEKERKSQEEKERQKEEERQKLIVKETEERERKQKEEKEKKEKAEKEKQKRANERKKSKDHVEEIPDKSLESDKIQQRLENKEIQKMEKIKEENEEMQIKANKNDSKRENNQHSSSLTKSNDKYSQKTKTDIVQSERTKKSSEVSSSPTPRLAEKSKYEYMSSDRYSPSYDSRARNISGESSYKDTVEKSMQTSNNLMSIVTGSLVPKAEAAPRSKPPSSAAKNEGSKPKKPSDVKKKDKLKHEAAKITPPGGVSDIMIKEVGNNWVSLCWKKPAVTRGSPVLTYKVESWLCGEGAFWVEIGRTPIPQFDVFNLKPDKSYHFRVTARNKRGWGDSIMTTHKVDLSRPTQMPSISSEHDPVVKAFLGSDLKLTLQTAGEPKPNVKWTRNSDSFDDEEGYNVYEDDMGCHIEMSGLTADFSGKYTLTAVNLAGRATKSVMVQVLNDEKIYEAYKQFKRYVFITQFKKNNIIFVSY